MTTDQEHHLEDIKRRICARLDAKYRKGVEEHGGNLWAVPVLEELLNEVTDLISYALTLEEKLALLKAKYAAGDNSSIQDDLKGL